MPAGDVILAFQADATHLRRVRSTLLVGSMAAVRDAGHLDRWSSLLSAPDREALSHLVAGVWVPVEIALPHYRACDALGLSSDAAARLGAVTFSRVRGTLLGTMLRMANGVGVTPWTFLPHLQRFWDRAYDGGAIQVVRTGPKDATLELTKCVFADLAYYRAALRGLLHEVFDLFTQKTYLEERPGRRSPGSLAFRAQWV